jgi:hypothetical protein
MIVNVAGNVTSNFYNYEINLTAQDREVQLIAKASSAIGNLAAISKSEKPKESR